LTVLSVSVVYPLTLTLSLQGRENLIYIFALVGKRFFYISSPLTGEEEGEGENKQFQMYYLTRRLNNG
jgi:hypothetical protein